MGHYSGTHKTDDRRIIKKSSCRNKNIEWRSEWTVAGHIKTDDR